MEKIVKKIEDIENPIDNIFKDNVDKKKRSIGLIHRAYLTQIKNSRKYLASTKTKSEVRGGGKKPWKQKGTGNARVGSSRSPLWKGGGVSFGPKPRTVNKKIIRSRHRVEPSTSTRVVKNSNVKTQCLTEEYLTSLLPLHKQLCDSRSYFASRFVQQFCKRVCLRAPTKHTQRILKALY